MNYTDKKWRRKREVILKRDEYLCRECKRYGITSGATTVHHIKPADDYPELRYNNKNLYSSCSKCHNSFHDRVTNELTQKGMDLLKRIYGIRDM